MITHDFVLTPKQHTIFRLLSVGYTRRQISLIMKLPMRTIGEQMRRVRRKAGTDSYFAISCYLASRGYLEDAFFSVK